MEDFHAEDDLLWETKGYNITIAVNNILFISTKILKDF
jgi:hypothetical protein